MANYDAGHYFLTFMAPVDRNGWIDVDGTRRSLIDHIRGVLRTLPTAQQDSFSADSGLMSPFASVPHTHFAHVFLIDDLPYNGRRPSNAILDLVFNVKMTLEEKVDCLPHAYVVFALDFDALDGSAAALKSYTDGLWRNMSEELKLILGNCIGFELVTGEDSFFDYVKKTQIDTSLPYNDYWTQEPPNRSPVPCIIGSSLVVGVTALAAFITGLWPWSGWGLIGVTLLSLIMGNLGIILKFGLSPFAPAPDSDLGSVLKALYVQQMFTGFAIDNQGASDKALFAAFDAFCQTHDPNDITGPRQAPGVLRTVWKRP